MFRRLLPHPCLVLLAVLLVGCTGGPDLVDPEDVPRPQTEGVADDRDRDSTVAAPELAAADCPAELSSVARCGFLIVPEDRSEPSGPVVEVAYARLPASLGPGEGAPRSPLVVIPDGPGISGLAEAEEWAESVLREGRDVVLIDPRGVGRSFPSLDCGQPPRPGALPLDLVEDCRRSLVAQGIALDAYDTAAIADDVIDLLGVLGMTRVNLLGVGHGSKVVLEVLRRDPSLLRSLVLDSAVPPEVDVYAERPSTAQTALNRLLDECVQQPACEATHGDLQPRVERLITDLNSNPAEVAPGETVTGDDLALATVAAMRGATGPGSVPAALATALAGQPAEALAALQEVAIAGAAVPTSMFSEGLRLSVDCREEVPFSRGLPDLDDDRLGAVGRAVATDLARVLQACELWQADDGPPDADQPVSGAVPTLVLTGEFDPLSPPAWGAAAAARMATAAVVQVGGAGHRVFDVDACTLGLVESFLTDPSEELDDDCAAERTVTFDLG